MFKMGITFGLTSGLVLREFVDIVMDGISFVRVELGDVDDDNPVVIAASLQLLAMLASQMLCCLAL